MKASPIQRPSKGAAHQPPSRPRILSNVTLNSLDRPADRGDRRDRSEDGHGSADVRSTPASASPARRPVSQAIPVTPPPPRTSALRPVGVKHEPTSTSAGLQFSRFSLEVRNELGELAEDQRATAAITTITPTTAKTGAQYCIGIQNRVCRRLMWTSFPVFGSTSVLSAS